MRKYKLQFNKNKTADSNGIIISEDIQFLSLKSNQRNYFHSIRCLIFIIAAFCSVFMAISFFPNIETDKTVIGFVTVTISLAFYCFTSRKRIIRYLSAVYIAFTCLYFLYYMSSITNGFYLVLKAYMINAKLPNNININYINPETYSHCATYFFAAFSIIIVFLLFIALIIRIDFPMLFLTTFPLFEMGVYWGFKPATICVFGVISCWIITLSLQIINHNSNKAGRKNTFVINRRKKAFYLTSGILKKQFFQTFIVFVSIICIGTFTFVTGSAYLLGYQRPQELNQVRDDVSEFTKSLTYQDFITILNNINPFSSNAYGGINEGKLGDKDEIKFNGSTALEITVPLLRDTLYLKGYTAGEYKNNRWISNENPDGIKSLMNIFNDNNMYIQDFNFFQAKQTEIYRTKDGIKEPDFINITVKNANKKYVYAPYAAMYSYNSNYFLDEIITQSWENIKLTNKEYELPFYNIAYLEDKLSYGSDSFNDLILVTDDERINVSDEYEFYASSAYMDTIESKALDNVYDIIRKQTNLINHEPEPFERFSNFLEVKNAIKQYFQENYQYSLAPGKTPGGEDFIDYFLSEQDKGYCTYFASAGTMLMRKFGFPARYVEGYAVSPTELKNPNEDGLYNITVKDKSAHAWTEVFIKEIGWIPCEFTPGYDNQIWPDEDSSSKADTPENNNSSKSESKPNNTIKSNDAINKNMPDKTMLHTILTITVSIIILISIVLFCIIKRKYNLNKLRKTINEPDKRKCVQNIYACCLNYLKLVSISHDENITDKQFALKAEKLCEKINIPDAGKSFVILTDIAVKACMSDENISFDDCAAARQILKKIRSEIFDNCLTKTQRFKAKWFNNLY